MTVTGLEEPKSGQQLEIESMIDNETITSINDIPSELEDISLLRTTNMISESEFQGKIFNLLFAFYSYIHKDTEELTINNGRIVSEEEEPNLLSSITSATHTSIPRPPPDGASAQCNQKMKKMRKRIPKVPSMISDVEEDLRATDADVGSSVFYSEEVHFY